MDTEVIVHLMARSPERDMAGRLVDALRRVRGSYSLLILAADRILAVRDPNGFRPLALGRARGGYVFASETCRPARASGPDSCSGRHGAGASK